MGCSSSKDQIENPELKMSNSKPWNVTHQVTGAPEPTVNPDKITVYNMRFCPFAQRTILTCLAKKVPFDVVNINLSKKPEWFVANTWGTVSVVRYKGHHIMESTINSDFVDELHPENQLHSSDPAEKALGRLLVELYGKMVSPYYTILRSKSAEDRQKSFVELLKTLESMNSELEKKGTNFFSGDKCGMTDLMVWPWIERLPNYDIMFSGENLVIPDTMTSLKRWISAMWEVPAVAEYGLTPEQHNAFYKTFGSDSPGYDALLPELKMSNSKPWNVTHQATGAPEPTVIHDKITVYNMRFCPFAQRTILTCLAKKVPFDVVNINLSKKPEWFVANTWGTVSVVRYKGHHIMESRVNSDFVDELHPENPLHSSDPAEKAQGRLLVELYGKIVSPYYTILRSKSAEDRQNSFVELLKTLELMDSELEKKGTNFFSGDKCGMTDLMVWPWIERLPNFDIMFSGENLVIPDKMTSLKRWISAMWEVPAVAEYGLSPEQHNAFYKSYGSGSPEYDALLPGGA